MYSKPQETLLAKKDSYIVWSGWYRSWRAGMIFTIRKRGNVLKFMNLTWYCDHSQLYIHNHSINLTEGRLSVSENIQKWASESWQ